MEKDNFLSLSPFLFLFYHFFLSFSLYYDWTIMKEEYLII